MHISWQLSCCEMCKIMTWSSRDYLFKSMTRFGLWAPKIFVRWAPDLYIRATVYPKKYAHGHCFAVLCCGYTLTDFAISIRLTSLALWQSNDCPSASKATLMNMDKYFMWIHYERLHNHNKAKHNKTVCIFLGIYCKSHQRKAILCTGHTERKFATKRHHYFAKLGLWFYKHICGILNYLETYIVVF